MAQTTAPKSSLKRNSFLKAPRESEEHFRLLFDHSPIGAVVTDLNYRLKRVNETYCRMLGYPEEELLSLRFTDITHPDDLENNLLLQQNVANGEIDHFQIEKRYIRKDGDVIWVSISVGIVRDPEGNPIHYLAMAEDITKRKRAELELFETNRRLQTLLDALPVGVGFSNNPNCKMVTGNPAFQAQFEVGPHDNISASSPAPSDLGHQVRYFINGKEVGDTELPLQKAVVEDRVIEPTELEVLMPNGRRWFLEATASPIRDAEGRVMGSVVVGADITERKRIEHELRKSRRELELHVQEIEKKSIHLKELNIALKALLRQMEDNKKEFGESVLANTKNLIFPYLERLKRTSLSTEQKSLIEVLEKHMSEISSSFARKLAVQFAILTPSEIRIAELIKGGKSIKEMAALLYISNRTVECHRDNIRKKLGLRNGGNLRSYLLTLA